MKSVLVIDTPKTCKECPCQLMLVCVPADEDIDEYIDPSKAKPNWCPLKPLPRYGALGSVITAEGYTLSTAGELLEDLEGETE